MTRRTKAQREAAARARREHEDRRRWATERLEQVVDALFKLYDLSPDRLTRLLTERDELRAQLKEAKQNQRLMGQHIQELQLALSVYEPGPPPKPSVSDEDYDAMLAKFAEEDERKKSKPK